MTHRLVSEEISLSQFNQLIGIDERERINESLYRDFEDEPSKKKPVSLADGFI